jgi:class 3 adenylate cyclase
MDGAGTGLRKGLTEALVLALGLPLGAADMLRDVVALTFADVVAVTTANPLHHRLRAREVVVGDHHYLEESSLCSDFCNCISNATGAYQQNSH